MACCKVCCGCKECDEGEEGKCCCGQDCCQPGTYCCNAECVSTCSEGQEGDCKCTDACCYQDEYCCNDACVPACAEGDAGPCKCGSSCCAEGEYCCDGECQAEPCEVCQPCEECSWPSNRSESAACAETQCCGNPGQVNGRLQLQEFTTSLPGSLSWKTGYPAALDGCNWRVVTDSAYATCYNTATNACTAPIKCRVRVMVIDCDQQSVVDITSDAVTGDLESEGKPACFAGAQQCDSDPDYPDFLDDPTPVCNP